MYVTSGSEADHTNREEGAEDMTGNTPAEAVRAYAEAKSRGGITAAQAVA
jgi:CRP-like cAMP-binding protein